MSDKDAVFLRQVGRHFQQLASETKEDRGWWANVMNGEYCHRIADRIDALPTTAHTKED